MNNVYKGFSLSCMSQSSLWFWSRRFDRTLQVSSSGDSVDLLSRTIFTTVVVSDWRITNLAHGLWVSIQSIVG